MQSTIQLSSHVNSHASVTHDVTSEFIISQHLVKSLHQLRFYYLNFLLEFESTFKTSFPYFFFQSLHGILTFWQRRKRKLVRAPSLKFGCLMVVLRTKLQFLIASIPEATRQVIIIVRQNPCILHPGEYTVGTLKAKNLTPPTPYPKKKKPP